MSENFGSSDSWRDCVCMLHTYVRLWKLGQSWTSPKRLIPEILEDELAVMRCLSHVWNKTTLICQNERDFFNNEFLILDIVALLIARRNMVGSLYVEVPLQCMYSLPCILVGANFCIELLYLDKFYSSRYHYHWRWVETRTFVHFPYSKFNSSTQQFDFYPFPSTYKFKT